MFHDIINGLGKKHSTRKYYRKQRAEFKAMCRREGWPSFRKLWKTQKASLHAAR